MILGELLPLSKVCPSFQSSIGTWIPFQHRHWEKEYRFFILPLEMGEKWSPIPMYMIEIDKLSCRCPLGADGRETASYQKLRPSIQMVEFLPFLK